MKTKRFNVRVSEKEKEALEDVCKKLELTEAAVVREAVREKIWELARKAQTGAELSLSN